MDKLLITGIDTLVGANLALAWRDSYQVVTLGCDDQPTLEGCTAIGCDLNDRHDIQFRILSEAPRWIVHCSPLSRSAWDALDHKIIDNDIDAAHEAQRALWLAEAAAQTSAALAVIVSDAVFAGPRMFHSEISPTTATHPLAEAVQAVTRSLQNTDALLVRTHAYGWSPRGGASFAETVCQQLTAGGSCPVDSQNYATPILASDLAGLLARALERNLRGVLHLAGAERASQYRFAAELAVAFGLTGRQVLLEPPKHRPARPFLAETSLNTASARRELRIALPMLREGLMRFAEQASGGLRAELQAARHAEWPIEQAA